MIHASVSTRAFVLPAVLLFAACASKPNPQLEPVSQQPAPPGSMTMSSGYSAAISQDPALAKKGEKLFGSKACGTCHTIGKGRLAGPDLAGVTSRRDAAWLRTWLHDPPAMVASGDAVATELVKEYKGVKMPNMKLTDADIDALLAYIESKGGKSEK